MLQKKMSAISGLNQIIFRKGTKATKDKLETALAKAGKEDFHEVKKESATIQPPIQTKNVKSELANQLAEYIKSYVTGGKSDLNVALRMANRTGILINDLSLTKILEQSYKGKETFKIIVETHNFMSAENRATFLS